MATTAVYQWHPAHRQEAHTECEVKTNSQLAAIAGVHPNTITQAKTVTAQAAPAVVAAVKSGELPQAEQATAAQADRSRAAAHCQHQAGGHARHDGRCGRYRPAHLQDV